MRQLLPKLFLLALVGCFIGLASLLVVAEAPDADQPPMDLSSLFGPELLTAAGGVMQADAITADRIGIYFSAIWCPPCRDFTPRLVQAYNELKKEGESFEVIFVSADRSAEAMQQYIREYKMPWLSIPFDSEARRALPQQHRVRGIPMLVIMDANGNVIEQDAVMAIRDQGAAAFSRW